MDNDHHNLDAPEQQGVVIEPYRGSLAAGSSVGDDKNATDAEEPRRHDWLTMLVQATLSQLRGWGMIIIHPFRADDQALSWAKQGTAWIALAWLVLAEAGDSGLFYWFGACAWLLFAAPALFGLFNIIRSAVIARHSSRQLVTASIIALGLAATAGLLIASVSVSKAGELLGNLEECCCYLCAKAAVEWYNSH